MIPASRPAHPPWCASHVRDFEGALLHSTLVGATTIAPTFPGPPIQLPVTVELYDEPPGSARRPDPAYLWVPYGEGIAFTAAAALAHIAVMWRGVTLLDPAARLVVAA